MNLLIVPARGGSKRIKEKNIIPFLGKPIIEYPLEAALDSQIFDKIHISTNSNKIKNVIEQKGFNVDLAKKIKKNTKIKVRTSGNIDDTNFADKLIEKKFIDQICVGRKFISDRFWILKNNKKLLVKEIANQYNRCF